MKFWCQALRALCFILLVAAPEAARASWHGVQRLMVIPLGGDQAPSAHFSDCAQDAKWDHATHGDAVATCREPFFNQILPPLPSNELEILVVVNGTLRSDVYLPVKQTIHQVFSANSRAELPMRRDFVNTPPLFHTKKRFLDRTDESLGMPISPRLKQRMDAAMRGETSSMSLVNRASFQSRQDQLIDFVRTRSDLHSAQVTGLDKTESAQTKKKTAKLGTDKKSTTSNTSTDKAMVSTDAQHELSLASQKAALVQSLDERNAISHKKGNINSMKETSQLEANQGAHEGHKESHAEHIAVGVRPSMGGQSTTTEITVYPFELHLTATPTLLHPGESLTVTALFRNTGKEPVQNPEIAFGVPRGLIVTSVSPVGGRVLSVRTFGTDEIERIEWSLGGIFTPGDSETVTFVAVCNRLPDRQ